MEKLKVAVISCGMIANTGHLPAYRYYNDRCEVCAVCDLNERLLKKPQNVSVLPAGIQMRKKCWLLKSRIWFPYACPTGCISR